MSEYRRYPVTLQAAALLSEFSQSGTHPGVAALDQVQTDLEFYRQQMSSRFKLVEHVEVEIERLGDNKYWVVPGKHILFY